jgi:hypothetical protein
MKNLAFVLCIFLSGCAGSQLARPKIPKLLSTSSPLVLYTTEAFQKDYAAYKAAVVACSKPSALEECTAKGIRDAIINRIKLDIELNYREYASQLFVGRASSNVGLDSLELGLSTAATLAGAAGTKTILAGILTGGKGIRLSIDKNFFAERTTPIILGRMEVLRESVANDLKSKMTLSVAEYPLEEAWNDLVEFFYAGTLAAGIQALANDMGQAAGEMKAQRSLRLQKRMK